MDERTGTVDHERPWRGRWSRIDGPLADNDELVLAIARRRADADRGAIVRELTAIDERFDVDAVYLDAEQSVATTRRSSAD